MSDRSNRTFISSVLFLDIVEYTKQPVAQQIRLKNQFNSLVSELIADISESDRIILDTGDGAALSFLGDPEDALFVAVKLRDALREKQREEFPDLHIRMGINLGPVKLLKDINGRPNLIGDGINVAQRVMSFANPDQILVSRSFYEVVSCLSTEYSQLFNYQGTQKDKHVREHELYEIGFSETPLPAAPSQSSTQLVSRYSRDDATPLPVPDGWDAAALASIEAALTDYVGGLARGLVRVQATKTKDPAVLRDALAAQIPSSDDRAAFLAKTAAIAAAATGARPLETIAVPATVHTASARRGFGKRPFIIAGAIAVLLIVVLVAVIAGKREAKPDAGVAAHDAGGPASAATAAPASKPPANTPAPAASEPVATDDTQNADKKPAEPAVKKAPRKTAPVVADTKRDATLPPQAPAPVVKAPEKSAVPVAIKTGTVVFQVNKTAELWVDGAKVGDSNSMRRYAVAPGPHKVEVRHCGFPPQDFTRNFDVVSEQSYTMEARCTE
jgi:phosphoribosyl-AMP cyclohydrolase